MVSNLNAYSNKLQIKAIPIKERKSNKRWYVVFRPQTNEKTVALTLEEAQSVLQHPHQLFGGDFPPRIINCRHCGCVSSKIVRSTEVKNHCAKLICLSCGTITGWLTPGQFYKVFDLHKKK